MNVEEVAAKNKLKLKVLYWYDLTNLKGSHKVRFVYAIKGRKGEDGLVQKLGGKFLVPGCFTLPFKKDREMQEILKFWKVKFKRETILVP